MPGTVLDCETSLFSWSLHSNGIHRPIKMSDSGKHYEEKSIRIKGDKAV